MTAGNDRGVAMRFIAFCVMEKQLPPSLALFGTPQLPDLVQEWLNHAVARGLMWSTLRWVGTMARTAFAMHFLLAGCARLLRTATTLTHCCV